MPPSELDFDDMTPPLEGQELFEGHAVTAGMDTRFIDLSATDRLAWGVMAALSDACEQDAAAITELAGAVRRLTDLLKDRAP